MNRVLELALRRGEVELRRHEKQAAMLPREDILCCRSAWHSTGKEETALVVVLGDSGESIADMLWRRQRVLMGRSGPGWNHYCSNLTAG